MKRSWEIVDPLRRECNKLASNELQQRWHHKSSSG